MKSMLFFVFSIIILTGCRKEYACVCTNPGGDEIVFTVKTREGKAKSKCADYYTEHYANIPWNETSCEIK